MDVLEVITTNNEYSLHHKDDTPRINVVATIDVNDIYAFAVNICSFNNTRLWCGSNKTILFEALKERLNFSDKEGRVSTRNQ